MARKPRERRLAEMAPPMRPPPPRRRRWPRYIIGLIVLLAVLWVGYWYGASQVANAAINRATAAPIGGVSFACPDHSISGFPLRLDIRCPRASVSADRGNVAASLGPFWASAPLYRPGFVDATLDGPLSLNVAGKGLALSASWTHATAAASAWLDGLQAGEAHLSGLAVENGGRTDALPVAGLTARTADVALAPIGSGDYRVHADGTDVSVKLTDGDPLPMVDASGNIVAIGVGPLGTDPTTALLKWARGQPSIKIEDLRIALGSAIVTLSGQLSLSKDGLLNGSVLFGYNSLDDLGNLVELIRPGGKAKYADPLKIVNSLTRSVNTPDGPMHQTSITFTDGVIWLAIFPLVGVDPIPPIRF